MTNNKLKILVVEDSEQDRQLLTKFLSQIDDVEICQAADGKQALTVLNSYSADLIITDIDMPVLDGLSLIRHVKASEITSILDPLILVVTAHKDRAPISEAFIAGATDYIPKPIEFIELKARVVNLLKRRKAELNLRAHISHVVDENDFLSQTNKGLQTIIEDLKHELTATQQKVYGLIETLSEHASKKADLVQVNAHLSRQLSELASKNSELKALLHDSEYRVGMYYSEIGLNKNE